MLQAIVFIVVAVAIAAGVGEGCSGGPEPKKEDTANATSVQEPVPEQAPEENPPVTSEPEPEPEPEPELPDPPAAPIVSVSRDGDDLRYEWTAVTDAQWYTVYYAQESFDSLEELGEFTTLTGAGNIEEISVTEASLANVDRGVYWYVVVTASKTEDGITVESVPSNEVKWIIATRALNDTGLLLCEGFDPEDSDWVNPGNCIATTATATSSGVYDDADNTFVPAGLALFSGRDAMARAGTLPKQGGGVAGFDFTRLNSDGTAYIGSGDFGSDPWSCVQDEVTGLVWEVKADSGPQANTSYTWYNTDNSSNGGNSGAQDVTKNCFGHQAGIPLTYCNTQAYTARVNSTELCGFNDWRLPSAEELMGILRVNPELSAATDGNYFPNAGYNNFWTHSPVSGVENSAWVVSFFDQSLRIQAINSAVSIRLVRGD